MPSLTCRLSISPKVWFINYGLSTFFNMVLKDLVNGSKRVLYKAYIKLLNDSDLYLASSVDPYP